MIKKLLFFILTITLPIKLSIVLADEITSFDFMDKGNNSFIIGANGSISGDLSIVVEDITQTKPYINLLVATTGFPDFVVTENNYFANTVIKKLYSSGSTNIDGYTADLYVVQFSTRGTNWSCSASGLNCSVGTSLRLNNTYSYNSMYQLQSIALTDTVLTDDYLANMQINQNNEIIEQGKETNEKLDDLNDTIQNGDQETQDVIKDQFNTCRDSYNLLQLQYSPDYSYSANGLTFIVNDDYSVTVSGTATANTFLRLQHDIALTSGTYYFSGGSDGTGTYIQLSTSTNYYANTSTGIKTMIFNDRLTILYVEIRIASGWNGEYTFYPMISKEKIPYEPYGKRICSNKIDDTNDKLDNLNDNITNDNVSGIEESFSQFEDFLDDNSTITQLITLPVTLYSSILQGVSSSCSPFNLGSLYGESLILPCINIVNYLGSTLWGMIDLIISGFAIYSISKKLIKVFHNFSSMKEGDVIDD